MQNLQAAARAKCPTCQPLLACEKTKAARSRSKRRRRQPSLCQPPLDSGRVWLRMKKNCKFFLHL